jgi:hypothetical protein
MLALANAPSSMTPEEQGFRRQVEMVTAVLLESHENFGTALPPGLDAKLKQPEPGNGSRKTK